MAGCARGASIATGAQRPTDMGDCARTFLLLLAALACSCSPQRPPARPAAPPGQAAAGKGGQQEPAPAYEAQLPEDLRQLVGRPFTGDLDQMVQRRIIRVGVPFNRTFYFIDNGVQRGLAYEYARMFEDDLNRSLKRGLLRVEVVMLPMRRGAFIPELRAGRIDMAFSQLTDTPERRKLVDFSNPTRPDVHEILVTGPGAPKVATMEDLGQAKVYVRDSSSYALSLRAWNRRQKGLGRPAVVIGRAPESLEDDDILEMINAGLAPATVVDDYKARFWKKVFPDLVLHDDLVLRRSGDLAIAIRQGSPQLKATLNRFIARYGLDSAIGRVLNQRYLQDTSYVKAATAAEDRQRFLKMESIFRRYGDQYRFDHLLMAAQGYQESHLNQGARSPVGAIGVMQLMPATGQEQHVGDVHQLDPNIHAGVKYLRAMRDRYFEREPMTFLDKGLFTFAAYNAGIGRIQQLRKVAAARGLDPNVWFDNVERVVSEKIGRETVSYVSNIYKYYLAYKLVSRQMQERKTAKAAFQNQAQAQAGEAR
jgi:membrane-bound lytic murein transglycosylase MltF